MKQLIIAIVALCGIISDSYGKQRPDSLISFNGQIFDSYTEIPIENARVSVSDTLGVTLIDSLAWFSNSSYRSSFDNVIYEGKVPRRDKYMVSIKAKGYQPEEFTIAKQSVNYSGNVREYASFGKIYLKYPKKEHRLDEVTVTASRIKMIMKGDTLVYDATAFQLPEGSMLDALIRELPGAQLDDNGRITVNGEFVQDLLINGRNFFSGDPQIALRNLPAFTVKDLRVYRREPDEFRGRNLKRDRSGDPLVMDVNLKKEYLGGWLANVEAGGGTSLKNAWDTRWMGRMFGMRYNKISYIAFHASANNLNDPQKAGSKGQWHKPNVSAGETTTKRAGIEFNTDWRDQSYNGINTTFNIIRQTNLTSQSSISEAFMAGGNTFSRSISASKRSSWNTKWTGEISRKADKIGRVWFRTEVEYDKGTARRTSSSAESNSMLPENFTAPGSEDYVRDMLYRRSQRLDNRDHTFSVNGQLSLSCYAMPKGHSAGLRVSGEYRNADVVSNNSDLIVYPNEQIRNINMLQHDLTPSRNYNFNITPNWYAYYKPSETFNINADLSYNYNQKYDFGRRTLEEMKESAGGEGSSPSVAESGAWFTDEANSYRTTRREWNHGILAIMNFNIGKYSLRLSDDATYSIRRLDDFRQDITRKVNRRDWKNYARFEFRKGDWWSEGLSWSINTLFTQKLPDLLKMLDVCDSSNPLVLNLGNPDLKRSKNYKVEASIRNKNTHGRQFSWDISGAWSRTDDELAMARTYNRETGVTTWRPANIDGNWSADATLLASLYLDVDRHMYVSNNLKPGFRHSVDYSSDGDLPEPVAVNSWFVRDDFMFAYDINSNIKVSAKVNLSWTQMKSLDGIFSPFDYLDINYGVSGHVKLPADIFLDTDLMAYCRSGYGDPSMNRTDWVWNLELSKTFGRAKQWTVKAIGFDLLQQLPTVERTLNAQGRSEVRVNSQPSYAILTLAYRFDMKPKKKQ